MNNIPTGVRYWNFSLDKQLTFALTKKSDKIVGQFKWQIEQAKHFGEWICDQAEGRADIIKSNGDNGSLILRCSLDIQGREDIHTRYAHIRPPSHSCDVDVPTESFFKNTYWRIDYHRSGLCWKITDMSIMDSFIVKELRGRIFLQWYHGETQVFHNGPIAIGKQDQIARFYTGDMLYGKTKA